jgi:hypothetical protein
MNPIRSAVIVLSSVVSAPTFAQQTEHPRGDHPAVIVKRLHAQQGYDYLSTFYPHPAWLYLSAEAPRPMMDHPAVIIPKHERREAQARALLHASARRAAATPSPAQREELPPLP